MDYAGIGAFFYPFILGITEENTLDDLLTKPPSFEIRKIVIDHKLKNNMRIIATDDGFIGIFEKSTVNSLRILNIIFATGISFGIGSEFVREKDCEFTLFEDDGIIQFDQIRGPSERNAVCFQRDSESGFAKWRNHRPRHVAPKEDVIRMLERSYDYLTVEDAKRNVYEDLLLALEGYTLYYREAFKGAYLYGWMIIETVIDQIWKDCSFI
jgi:hypothetical protein